MATIPIHGEAQESASKSLCAVISAYEPETEANTRAFLGTNQPTRIQWINGVKFQFVRFAGHNLVLFPCGISTVNGAMTTQLALDHFPIDRVLFAGIAGGINPRHGIGDVVIPERWAHHSEAAYYNPNPDGKGYRKEASFQQKYENFGFLFPVDVMVIRNGETTPRAMSTFAADPDLLAAARTALPTIPPLSYAGRTNSVEVGGTGITGPVFCDYRAYREWAFRVWHAECVDMESTAIAQVCWASRVPFLIVRSLSDLAGGQEGENPEDFNEKSVSEHASQVLRAVILALPPGR